MTLCLFCLPNLNLRTSGQQSTGEVPKGNSQLLKMRRCHNGVFSLLLPEADVGVTLGNLEDTDVFESYIGRTIIWKSQVKQTNKQPKVKSNSLHKIS